jgi:hypothetical protein
MAWFLQLVSNFVHCVHPVFPGAHGVSVFLHEKPRIMGLFGFSPIRMSQTARNGATVLGGAAP